jgi:hypothetical protein
MSPRLRKLIGLFGILGFLAAYVLVVVTIGEHLPNSWWVHLVFYGLAGSLWGVPLFPLISWMNRER